jgi:streptogramin lyase
VQRGAAKSAVGGALASIVLLALVALAAAPSALAAPSAIQAYGYSHTFASEGQMAPAAFYNGIGFDPQTGDVIVVESGRLAVYAPDAGPGDLPITTFGEGLGLADIAVAPNGDVYASKTNGLVRFKRNPGSPPTYTEDASYAPEVPESSGGGLAIDPSTGDLLFTPRRGEVIRYSVSGAHVSTFLSQPGGLAYGVAATADGTIFVLDFDFASGGAGQLLFRFSASGQELSRRAIPSLTAQLAYDPLHDSVDLLTADAGAPAQVEGLNSEGKRIFDIPFPESTKDALNAGIALDPAAGRLYGLTAAPNGVQVFEPATYPGVETPVVTGITPTGAHVSTEVDPGSGPPAGSFARFEYSLNEGAIDWTPSPDQSAASASTVEADLTGLLPNRRYLIRAAAGNDAITHFSEPTPITTAPVVPATVTDPATAITETGAVLNGSINPVGLQTTYHFEYGTTAAYGSRVPVGIDAIAGGTYLTRAFNRTLTGLQPGTTYHYRLVATNSVGVSPGEDRTFTTLAAGSALARVFEQVTPVDKNGGSINENAGFQVSTDGRQLAYMESSSGISLSSPLYGVSLSRRGSADWNSISVDPPLNVGRSTLSLVTLAVSPDFSHAFVVSNRALAPGAIANATNLYVVDLATNSYELVGSTEAPFAMEFFTATTMSNKFIGGTTDFGTVIFAAAVPMFPGAPQQALYRWSRSGGLEIESRLPGGAVPPTAIPSGPPIEGLFRMSSDDARRVYYTLAGGPEAGVYLREDGEARAISVSHRAGDDPTVPQVGEFLGSSKDGRYAFLTATSVPLTEDAPAAENDVYRYDADTGELEYLGTQISSTPSILENALAVSDDGSTFYLGGGQVWRNGHLQPVPDLSGVVRPANAFVSPDGRYFAFWAPAPFGFPSEPANEAVYLYDAANATTTCASCRPDGSNPGGAQLPNSFHFYSNQSASPLDDQGNLYFTSKVGLAAADGNGSNDVYEYSDGKLKLITPGTQPFAATFADVSPDGRDVYFTTTQGLVSRDLDQELDVYDARVGGGLAAQNPPVPQECLRDDCKAAPSSAAEPRLGGSELLQGPGNVKPRKHGHACPKGKRAVKHKGKSRCVKRHPKKANHHRRQGR